MKRYILRYIVFTAIFAMLTLAEKELGLYGIAIGFLFALAFCREKAYVAPVCFFAAQALLYFSVDGIIYASVAPVAYTVDVFLHRRKKLRHTFWEAAVLIIISMTPYIGLNFAVDYSLLRIGLSLIIGLCFGGASIVGCYPALVRGLRYRLSRTELFCAGAIVCVASIGIGGLEVFYVKLYFFVVAAAIVFLKATGSFSALAFGVASGIGGAIGAADPMVLCTVAVVALVTEGLGRYRMALTGIVGCVAYCAVILFFNGKFDIYAAVPFFVGGIAAACIPPSVYKRISRNRRGYVGRYAMRTVVNRDRETLSSRLEHVATAFAEMQEILSDETDSTPSTETVVDKVCERTCADCRFCTKCVEKFDVRGEIRRLVGAGATNGKCTVLDVGSELGENCRKVSFVLTAVNDGVTAYRRLMERRSGIEQGRDMLVTQIGGAAILLSDLAKSVKSGVSFDVDKENELIDKLGQADIIAADAIIYGSGVATEVTAVIREGDAKKRALVDIVSEVVGIKMAEYSQKPAINGMIGVSFCRAPVYKIMYGESVFSKEQRCGDTRQAVKINKNKLMFVLSDGMGTGKSAHFTAGSVTRLIESFYKAGFDHGTIFSCAAGLMSLRTKEDFSALDVVVVDVATGDADFVKQGGAKVSLSERKASK